MTIASTFPAQQVVIALVDDATHLQSVWPSMPAPAAGSHWLLVACAPRMAQRPSKWGSHRVREQWRSRWSAKLFEELGGWFQARGHGFTPLVAEGPLPDFTAELMRTHANAQMLDLRRPKGEAYGAYAPNVPVAPSSSVMPPANRLWSLVAGVLGLGLLFGSMAE